LFFKKPIQTITGVWLRDELRAELKEVDKQCQHFLMQNSHVKWRSLTIDAYLYTYEAKKALEMARSAIATNKEAWSDAYAHASVADKAITALLEHKLLRFLSPNDRFLGTMLIFFSAIAIPLFVIKPIKKYYNLTLEQVDNLNALIICMMFAPQLIRMFVAFHYQKNLEELLFDSSLCQTVLDEAQKAGVNFDTHQNIVIKKQTSWSNDQLLEDIRIGAIPDNFLCNISLGVMTKPVYCKQHAARYDEKNIHNWIRLKNIHPIVHEDLYWEDLIPDTSLEREIDAFVHDEVKKYIQHETMHPLVEQLEMSVEYERAQRVNQSWRIVSGP